MYNTLYLFRYLPTGETFTFLSYTFRVGISAIHEIVTEIKEVVWKLLQLLHISVPTTEKWINIAK
jgi:hypothetical protein